MVIGRRLVATVAPLVVGLVLASPGTGRADVAAYVQGHGVAGADATSELSPGNMAPAHGTGLGWRAGGRVWFLESFVGRMSFGDGAAADRAVVGVTGDVGLGNMRLRGAAGIGAMRVRGGALGFESLDRSAGALARVAVAFDVSLGAGFWLGTELETITYRLVPAGGSILDDSAGGSAVLGSLRLAFELGF